MSTHTPGPWKLANNGQPVVYGVEDKIGKVVVAHCAYEGVLPPEVDMANARLIAHAPALLQLIREIANRTCENQQGADWEVLMWCGQEAEALLAQIEQG